MKKDVSFDNQKKARVAILTENKLSVKLCHKGQRRPLINDEGVYLSKDIKILSV